MYQGGRYTGGTPPSQRRSGWGGDSVREEPGGGTAFRQEGRKDRRREGRKETSKKEKEDFVLFLYPQVAAYLCI